MRITNNTCKAFRKNPLAAAMMLPLLVSGLAVSVPGLAAEWTLEEVTVTARKRSESLQDVPFSINAQTEDQMRNSGATNLETLANNVSGLSVQNLGPGQSQVAIRGISAGQVVRDQPGVKEQVGVYLDESVISLSLFTPDLDFFDMNRVEVLRGPQGTLFGSGSLSGTVRYISNQPDLEAVEGAIESTLTSVEDGEAGGDIKGMINIPLSETVALRAVGYHTSYAGFIDAVQPDGSVKEDVNGGDRNGFRVALAIQPNELLTITPRVIYQEIDVDGFNREDAFHILGNPYTTTRASVNLDDREQFTQTKEKFEDEFLLFDTVVEYEIGETVLTSVTSYTDREVLVLRDSTQLAASVTYDAFSTDEADYTLTSSLADVTEVEVFTQELRLASNSDDALQWVGGVFYSEVERSYSQQLDIPGFEAQTGVPTAGPLANTDTLYYSAIPYELEQIALFGEISYDFTDALSISAGLRYFDFEESRELNFDGLYATTTVGLPGETSSDGFSPRIIASYALNEEVQLNAQVSKGFRLGGINDPLNAALCSPQDLSTFGGQDTFEDEELTNYELGAKINILDGLGTFNVAAFYSDIENLQATLDAGSCSSRIVYNVPEARSMGVEFELFAHPTENFEFGVSGSFINAELKSTVTSDNGAGNVAVIGGIEDGNRLPTTPEFQMSASATYTVDLADNWEGFLTGTYQYVGSRYTQIADQTASAGSVDLTITPLGSPSASSFDYDSKLPSYQVGNLRAGVRSDQWEVAMFINNITDEQALLSIDRERGGRARVGYTTNQPRTLGMTARYLF